MEQTDGKITRINSHGNTEESFMFTYSEEEKQKQEENAANAERIWSPKFIPIYPELLDRGLTLTEAMIFGFIDFYTSNGTGRFYFSNKQIAQVVRCEETRASKMVSKLCEVGLISVSHKMKAGGGRIRFIECLTAGKLPTWQNANLVTGKMPSSYFAKCQVHINKNKIKENKLNTSSSFDNDGDSFEIFWNHYPRKVGKGDAKKVWSRIKAVRSLLPKMLELIEAQKKSEGWRKENGQFIPYPARWLRGERWNDQPISLK